ncbi:glycosyltransferase [Reichenbachiella versicolor]|uniref:glycosyltransferase n=1 Tax=Reichenbachiella versicolor TaxID=1821036 RepID=UPI000D6E2307|nr:glycosyltransferase [Reichenbachiella versicolor]
MKRVLILSPYPFGTAGSQRFRYEQYLDILESNNIHYKHQSFLDENTWKILYKPGNGLKKISGILNGFLRRFWQLLRLSPYDFIFIHREAAPIGPPVFEWIIAKLWNKKVIYDFDDAIWLENTTETNLIASIIKFPQKVGWICRWSYKASVGNQYLAEYASKHAKNVFINPTTIDTENLHYPNSYQNTKTVIGWTGTHSTLKYLEMVKKILINLKKKYDFEVRIIADKEPHSFIKDIEFKAWDKETEIEDLNQIDIGIMPLTDDIWAKGKCGFKALQYMALEKPVLASPVGVNTQIVDEGKSGFLCISEEDWKSNLQKLLESKSLRQEMGKYGRSKVIQEYSVSSNSNNFLSLFQ